MSDETNSPTIISVEEFQARAGTGANPYLSVLIERGSPAGIGCVVSRWQDMPHPRAMDAAEYIGALAKRLPHLPEGERAGSGYGLFQAEDNPANVPSVSWQGHRNWDAISLIPDLYYFRYVGYEDFMPGASPAWSSRRPQLIWRGSSTGIISLSHAFLDQLPRYRLCREALRLGDAADVKLSSIVQASSDADYEAIDYRIRQENILGGWVGMKDMAQCKYIADIDGNANSWNFMMKLRLGACVLKVESDWTQWFSESLHPWVHFVPVRSDLSDLVEKVEWCRANDAQAAHIAEAGRQFALRMNFNIEMDAATRKVFLA